MPLTDTAIRNGKPVADITAPQLSQVIRRIKERGAPETAQCQSPL